jgi:hypothetical protein
MNRASRVRVVRVVALLWLAGCNNSGAHLPSPTAPSAPTSRPTPPANVPLVGCVRDTAFRLVGGARVEMVDGPQAGTSTTTNDACRFEFSGPFVGSVTLRATKDGYAAATTVADIFPCCGANVTIWMASLAPPVLIAGDYSLTFIADSACVDLPDEVRTRTYAATITPGVPSPYMQFSVTLQGASFFRNYNQFFVSVFGDYLTFELGGAIEGPYVVERLAPTTYVAFDGSAAGTVATSAGWTLSTSFDSSIDYCVKKSEESGTSYAGCRSIPDQTVAHVRCISKNHRVILTRR